MAKQTEAAKKEADRKKQIREKNKSSVISFFNKYIAGRRTKIKTKNNENAKTRVESKTKTMADKYKSQMSKIAKNEKGVKSSQTDAQKFAKLKSDATKKLMAKKKSANKINRLGKSPGALGGKIKTRSPGALGGKLPAKKTPKTPIVTKEQLAKSGLSLRDYMNFMQGKTRREDKKSSVKKGSSKVMVDSFKKSNVKADKNKKAGIDSAKGDNKKVKNFKKDTNPKLDSKGNYKGTNIKPTKLQLERMNKRRAKKGNT